MSRHTSILDVVFWALEVSRSLVEGRLFSVQLQKGSLRSLSQKWKLQIGGAERSQRVR